MECLDGWWVYILPIKNPLTLLLGGKLNPPGHAKVEVRLDLCSIASRF